MAQTRRTSEPRTQRFLDNRGQPTFETIGLPTSFWRDLYYRVLEARWPTFLGCAFAGYLLIHALFATLYQLQPGSIANSDGSFESAYFFSVQTLMTIGYGGMGPATFYANVLVTLEAFGGLLSTAMLTGLVFAKFTKPKAAVLWSEPVVICVHDGIETLMIRMANARGNRIVEASLSMTMAITVTTKEGQTFRRILDLPLVRRSSPVFSVSFTAMHKIDEQSPLFGETRESLRDKSLEIMAVLVGVDETSSQSVHSRRSYMADDLRFGERFADIIDLRADGRRIVDYRRFHETVPAIRPAAVRAEASARSASVGG